MNRLCLPSARFTYPTTCHADHNIQVKTKLRKTTPRLSSGSVIIRRKTIESSVDEPIPKHNKMTWTVPCIELATTTNNRLCYLLWGEGGRSDTPKNTFSFVMLTKHLIHIEYEFQRSALRYIRSTIE